MFSVLFAFVGILNAVAAQELWHLPSISSTSQVFSAFHASHQTNTEALSVVSDPAGGSGHVLRAHYPKGSYSHSSGINVIQFYATPIPSHTSVKLSYDVYFSENFDFVKGGKLPGLWGGATGTCSGGRHSEECFSTRFMWRTGGAGEVYGYITRSHQRSDLCDQPDVHCDPVYGSSLGRGKWHFRKGQWQNIAQLVHLNTPGKADGYIKVYLDGSLVFELNNVAIRSKESIEISGIFFSTFFGGSDSSWAATVDCYSYFKNFVLAAVDEHPVG
ncbi:hypothetical protein C0Q70_02360 [Pomacea canaliculata]|uniref:Polysaccharide lyase 14 domain-containing protein n=2 Tax=Pomacea canaliculata TaxID=400727 RepID=A0A2T7PPQ6_POMCA|nr:uncharacterized protein LOC112558222 isoform X3 [Pomacea canaliculata]PVD35398.1 hypothetical protein C0Q70_02360 [Pomacea canaliculata]